MRKSGIYDAIHNYRKEERCKIHWVDVDGDGHFIEAGTHDADSTEDTWTFVSKTNVRVPCDPTFSTIYLSLCC